ncbi:hypothetical protein QVD17_29057 [Tagetes erecta]|uniref:Cytochrome P450 n=1 Tax=Tagetes erecta TaxID=13708 RepID=A0AAD8KBB9_TARER|nr:hypothetical protein QVD17_29057 [Tagetes erecta]
MRGSIKSIIDKRIVAMKAGEASHDDLLGILLDSNYKEIKQRENNNFGLSIEDIIEECKLFYFAGQETTGNMLVWTMILLAKHIEWQARAREEVLRVIGDRKLDIDSISRLKVINIIFNEVLRLYSPAVSFRRMIHEETKLDGLTLPAGSLIQINTLILHHDKDMWGEDVNEFKPERFSEGVSKVTKGQAVYLPFGGGPRICIGQNFALLEAKMALGGCKFGSNFLPQCDARTTCGHKYNSENSGPCEDGFLVNTRRKIFKQNCRRTPTTSLSEWADAYGLCRENAYGRPPLWTRGSLYYNDYSRDAYGWQSQRGHFEKSTVKRDILEIFPRR